MDEMAYKLHIKRANEADSIYEAIRDLYGWKTPWIEAYFMAIKDKLLDKKDKELVKEFHPLIRR